MCNWMGGLVLDAAVFYGLCTCVLNVKALAFYTEMAFSVIVKFLRGFNLEL